MGQGQGQSPVSTGHYVGLAKAKKAYYNEVQRGLRLEAHKQLAKELETMVAQLHNSNVGDEGERPPSTSGRTAAEDRTTAGLTRTALVYLGIVESVANRSKNLKGPFIPEGLRRRHKGCSGGAGWPQHQQGGLHVEGGQPAPPGGGARPPERAGGAEKET